jgi:hypothetical protein
MFRRFSGKFQVQFSSSRMSVCVALLGLAVGSLGCNRGPAIPKTEPVSGTVTLKGKPVAGAEVFFVHERLVAYGKTD